MGTSRATGLPFVVCVAVKLLPYRTLGVYLLLATFLDSRTVVLIQHGQSAASVFMYYCTNNTYVASSFATGHRNKASETSVRDYARAAYSLPMRCHLLFVHLDMQKSVH